jgi:hypothetical protein
MKTVLFWVASLLGAANGVYLCTSLAHAAFRYRLAAAKQVWTIPPLEMYGYGWGPA